MVTMARSRMSATATPMRSITSIGSPPVPGVGLGGTLSSGREGRREERREGRREGREGRREGRKEGGKEGGRGRTREGGRMGGFLQVQVQF